MKFIVAALSFMLVVPCALAQQPIAGTNMSRWREYQEKLNQSREERELRSRGTFPAIPAEGTISVARLRHAPPAKALKALQHGLKLDRAGDSAGSAEAFRQAVALDPDYSEAHTNLGAEYINLGQIDDAITEFRSAIALDPATSVHHAYLGSALIILGRVREAEAEARTAVALDRTDMKAQYLLGYLLVLRPETRAAGEEYLRYAARELLDAHSMLAELYERTGRGALAEAEWEMYIQGVNAQAGGRHGGSRARPRAR